MQQPVVQHLDTPMHDAILAWCDQATSHDEGGARPHHSGKANMSDPGLTGVGDVMDDCRGVTAATDPTPPHRGGGDRMAYASQGLNSSNTSSTRSSELLGRPGLDSSNTSSTRSSLPEQKDAANAPVATSLLHEEAKHSEDRGQKGCDLPLLIPLPSEPAAFSAHWGAKGSSPFANASFALASSGELFPTQPKQAVWGGAEACTQILALTTSGRVSSLAQGLKGDFGYPCSSTASSLSLGISTPSSQGFEALNPTPWSSSGASSVAGLSAPSSQTYDSQYSTSGSGSGASPVAGLSIPSPQTYDAQCPTSGSASGVFSAGRLSTPSSQNHDARHPTCGSGVSAAAGISSATSQGHDVQQQTPWSARDPSPAVAPHAPLARQQSSSMRAQSAGSPMPRACSGRPPLAPRTSGSGSGALLQRWLSGGANAGDAPPQRGAEGLPPAASVQRGAEGSLPPTSAAFSSKRTSSGGSSGGAMDDIGRGIKRTSSGGSSGGEFDAIGRGINEQMTLGRPVTAPAGLGKGGGRRGTAPGLASGASGEGSDASLRSASEDPSFGDQHPFGVLPGTLEAADATNKGEGTGTPKHGVPQPQDLPALARGLSIRVPNSHFAAVEAMPQNRIQVRPTTHLHSPFEAIALQPFNDSRDEEGSDTPSASRSSSALPEAPL